MVALFKRPWMVLLALLAIVEICSVGREYYAYTSYVPPEKITPPRRPLRNLWHRLTRRDRPQNDAHKPPPRPTFRSSTGALASLFVVACAVDAAVRAYRSYVSAALRRDDFRFRRDVLRVTAGPPPPHPLLASLLTLAYFGCLLPASLATGRDAGGEDARCLVGYGLSLMTFSAVQALRTRIKSYATAMGARFAKAAVRNPLWARRRLGSVLRAVRYIKYGGPIVGTLNKLKGNVGDLIKKYRQARVARYARRVLRGKLVAMTQSEREEFVALQLQAAWRARVARRCVAAWSSTLHSPEERAARVIQRAYRVRVECRECALKETDSLYKTLMREWKDNGHALDMAVRSEKVQAVAKAYRVGDQTPPKLLMRPNTKFAVVWKIFFVCCIVLELSNVTLSHYLTGGKANKLSMDQLLMTAIATEDAASSLDSSEHVGGNLGVHQILLLTAHVTISYLIVPLIHIVCFLDVPVTFFTGELDQNTGVLIPKPFFMRWILPGLVLQLLVNPAMGAVVRLLKYTYEMVQLVGFALVVRWVYCLGVPLCFLISKRVQDLIHKENKNVVVTKKKKTTL